MKGIVKSFPVSIPSLKQLSTAKQTGCSLYRHDVPREVEQDPKEPRRGHYAVSG